MPVAQDTRLDTFLRAAWRRFKGAQKGELSIIVLANVSPKSIILYNITIYNEWCAQKLCKHGGKMPEAPLSNAKSNKSVSLV